MQRALLIACLTACAAPTSESTSATSEAPLAGATMAVLAGVTGRITTGAYYSGGGVHPGINAWDIGAAAGTTVWHQIDYIPGWIAGGWVHVYEVHDPGRCSQWYPDSPYHNGYKIGVTTDFYDASWNHVGSQTAYYQHVDPDWRAVGGTWTWNNAASPSPLHEAADLWYGNGQEGGLVVGWVHDNSSPAYNGPDGYLCAWGSHLHQEGGGWRASQRWVGQWVTDRYNDMVYF